MSKEGSTQKSIHSLRSETLFGVVENPDENVPVFHK